MKKSATEWSFGFFVQFCMLFILLVAAPARAWYDVGHMVAAQITWERLNEPAKKEITRLLKILGDAEPAMTDFVQASTWMDQQNGKGLSIFSSWHFIDQPYVVDPPRQLPAYNPNNAVTLASEAIKTLRNPRASDFAKALMLRSLMHVMVDLFQPMHVVSRFSKTAPHGDNGGTGFRIKPINWEGEQITSLHRLWDTGVLGWPKVRWFDSDWKQKSEKLAHEIKGKVDISTIPKLPIDNPQAWANHSYQIAIDFAYKEVKFNGEVSSSYLLKGKDIATRQIVAAAVLQAMLFNSIWKI
ncbi:S1/P1 nuclease [Endozoicomonadaceae bacterium StTr2]